MKNEKLATISIGIPAHNEEQLLPLLLQSLLTQEENAQILKEIIIIADGCTDKTVEKVKTIGDGRIRTYDDGKRKGKSARLNEIIEKFSAETLVLMDADITIRDKSFLIKIASYKNLQKSGVVGVNTLPVKSRNFFQACLNYSVIIQRDMIKHWREGENYLSFRGACIVLDRSFAKKIQVPERLVNNDAYFYFYARQKGYHPTYLEKVVVYFTSPMSLSDHINQSSRFKTSQNELEKYLKIDPQEYHIPKSVVLRSTFLFFLRNPILFAGYLGIFFITLLRKNTSLKAAWETAKTTKNNP